MELLMRGWFFFWAIVINAGIYAIKAITVVVLRDLVYTRRTWVFGEARCVNRAREQGAATSNSRPIARSRNAAIGCERGTSRPKIRVRRVYNVQRRLFGLEDAALARAVVQYLGNFKLLIICFYFTPRIAILIIKQGAP